LKNKGTGNREQRTGNREQGTGNREQGTGNREQGTGNREQGTGRRYFQLTTILKTGCSFTSKITKSIDIQRFLPGQKSSIYPFPV